MELCLNALSMAFTLYNISKHCIFSLNGVSCVYTTTTIVTTTTSTTTTTATTASTTATRILAVFILMIKESYLFYE